MENGGVLTVTIGQRETAPPAGVPGVPAAYATISVEDQGKGIPTALIPRVFEPFFTTKGERGTGLGLWVSRGIISKHGGFIRLRSCSDGPNTGTVFRVFLPIAERSGDTAAQVAAD
jgi:signal transduction histidine kinase